MYSALFGAIVSWPGALVRETWFFYHDFEISYLPVEGFINKSGFVESFK